MLIKGIGPTGTSTHFLRKRTYVSLFQHLTWLAQLRECEPCPAAAVAFLSPTLAPQARESADVRRPETTAPLEMGDARFNTYRSIH